MGVLNAVKSRLLNAGPDSFLLLQAMRMQAALNRTQMRVTDRKISLARDRQRVVLGFRDIISVPFVVHEWNNFFDTLEGDVRDGWTVLDFSAPGLHRYRKHDLSFYAPSLSEDDSMEAYTEGYVPKPGDVVWDAGAHAGLTSYFLAKMVGPSGRVFAFEPDNTNYEYLLRNIELHHLENVTPVKAALSGKSGKAVFFMDGTMSAGLADCLAYSTGDNCVEVETLSLEDACERTRAVPNFIKADIEGAELTVVEGSLEFLKANPIHLVFESNHIVDGEMTSVGLEKMLPAAGYRVWSSDEFGQRFTWAQPLASAQE